MSEQYINHPKEGDKMLVYNADTFKSGEHQAECTRSALRTRNPGK